MKKLKLLILITLLGIVFTSCGDNTPVLDAKDPFIVSKIELHKNGIAFYYAQEGQSSRYTTTLFGENRIGLPVGQYNIGDTISILKR